MVRFMALDGKVKTSILHEIERWFKIIKGKKPLEPVESGKKDWRFINEKDWRWGHFVGMIEGLAILYHHINSRRQVTSEELQEIEEFIDENTREIRQFFYEKS